MYPLLVMEVNARSPKYSSVTGYGPSLFSLSVDPHHTLINTTNTSANTINTTTNTSANTVNTSVNTVSTSANTANTSANTVNTSVNPNDPNGQHNDPNGQSQFILCFLYVYRPTVSILLSPYKNICTQSRLI